MAMDIAALQAFLAVADDGSFSRAAAQLHITQPATSKRIAALEHELGVALFDRIGRRIRLTPAGQALEGQARAILREVEEAKRRIANLSEEVAGPLRLATSYHVGLHRLAPALKTFYEVHPDVQLDLRFMDSEAACRAVERGELEVAVVTLPPAGRPPLRTETIWTDPLEIVVGTGHPLARRARAGLTALADHPAILPVAGTYTRSVIEDALGTFGRRLRIGLETNYLEVIKMLVSIGLGWSALPHTLIDDEIKVVQIEKIEITRQLGVVTHAARTLSNAAVAMIKTVRETA